MVNLILLFLLPLTLAAAPKLTVTPVLYDAGKVFAGTASVNFAYSLKNSGDDRLVIASIRPLCSSCTEVKAGKQELAPGESTRLEGRLALAPVSGVVRKRIAISSNDPAQPVILLAIQAHVLPRRTPKSELKTSGYITVRKTPEGLLAALRLTNADHSALTITAVQPPPGWVVADTLPLTIPPEESGGIRLRQDPAAEEAVSGGNVIVETDHQRNPTRTFKLTVPKTAAENPGKPNKEAP